MEIGGRVDQNRRRRVRRFLAEQADLLRWQGTVVATWRRHRGNRLGPYYKLVFRQEGRQRALYLGRDEDLADEVRRALERLRAPELARRRSRRNLSILRRAVAASRRAWRAELERYGLTLKGAEVRGWRTFRATRPAVNDRHTEEGDAGDDDEA